MQVIAQFGEYGGVKANVMFDKFTGKFVVDVFDAANALADVAAETFSDKETAIAYAKSFCKPVPA